MQTQTKHDEATRKINDRLIELLDEAGISLREAAERTGIPLGVLDRNLFGTSPILVSDLFRLTDLLGMKVSDLMAEIEQSD